MSTQTAATAAASGPWRRAALAVLAALALSAFAAPASADHVHWESKALLKSFFSTSDKVTYIKVALTDAELTELTGRLGYAPERREWTLFVGTTGGVVDGFAVIDNEKGQHLPITMAVLVSPDGVVKRQELMVYREAYGEEIESLRFRTQFVGKGSRDAIRLGEDVVAVSGATISSQAACRLVRRFVQLVEVLKPGHGPLLQKP